MDNREKFEYNYSAPTEEERMEINSIRKEYASEERAESKLERLRALDRKVKRPAVVFSVVFGIVAVLVFGVGMCFAMKVIGDLFIPGVVIGVIGIAMCVADYFLYRAILKARKKKYGEEILRLSEELLNCRDGQ